jgi:hypothetical protein
MRDEHQRWKNLCERASVEQDPKKLLKLIEEINNLFAAKEAARTETAQPAQLEQEKAEP